jgi:hypothetical protein
MSAASSELVNLINITLKNKREESGGDGKGYCTQTGKFTAVQVCWQTLIFSRSVGYIRISPECLQVNLNF